jgi:hypothetical protein
MRYVTLSVLLLAALAAGNPIYTTINEFGFDDSTLGWVEVHPSTMQGPELDMTGWLLSTNTSVCTFAYTMPRDGFLIVDSASLAGGEYGSGTFRLDPAGDTIRLVPDPVHPRYADSVVFPVLPADGGHAPMPPAHGSASMAMWDNGWTKVTNWYIDSTPTREMENDDYSTVTGIVKWGSGHHFSFVDISVFGPMGISYSSVPSSGMTFEASCLGAGRYEVAACGYPGGVTLIYPDSVDVGYSQVVSGINFDFDPPGVGEGQRPTAYGLQPAATVMHRLPVGAVVFDAMGRRVVSPRSGIYFVREGSEAVSSRLQATYKVVITR